MTDISFWITDLQYLPPQPAADSVGIFASPRPQYLKGISFCDPLKATATLFRELHPCTCCLICTCSMWLKKCNYKALNWAVLQNWVTRLYKWLAMLNILLAKQVLSLADFKGKMTPLIWIKQNSVQFVIKHLLQLLHRHMWKRRSISWLPEVEGGRWVCLFFLPSPVSSPAVISAGLCFKRLNFKSFLSDLEGSQGYPSF